MSTITGLSPQKRNPNRINVFLDGSFAFGLSRINAAWLKVGQEISEEKISQLHSLDEHEKALQSALRYLSFRNRSEYEVSKKMSEKGFAHQEIETVIKELKAKNYLGDNKFAKEWVENRTATKPRGRRLLINELRQKRVNDEEIQNAMEGLVEEEELASKAVEKITNRMMPLEKNQFRKKISDYLFRRGFSYDVISKTVDYLWKEKKLNELNQRKGQ